MMLFNGISSVNLSAVSINSANLIPFIGSAAELYTAGCEVSIKEGEWNTLR
jgi:hypothetical protein